MLLLIENYNKKKESKLQLFSESNIISNYFENLLCQTKLYENMQKLLKRLKNQSYESLIITPSSNLNFIDFV